MSYTGRQILIGLHNKFNGDFDKIYDFISHKKELDFDLDLSNENDLITIVDTDYPYELKQRYKPSFVITKEQATTKVYEITLKVRVIAFDENEAREKAYDDIDALCIKSVKKVR